MPHAVVKGQQSYFEDRGGHGPTPVSSHGLLKDRAMFMPQVAAPRGRFRCIVWDERGHVGGDIAITPYRAGKMAATIPSAIFRTRFRRWPRSQSHTSRCGHAADRTLPAELH